MSALPVATQLKINSLPVFRLCWPAPNEFLWGGFFNGIIDSFGRPEVQHWTALGFEEGPQPGPGSTSNGFPPKRIRWSSSAKPWTAPECAHVRQDGAHSEVLAVDPRTWQLVRYSLWRDEAPKSDEVRYRILHLSSPRLGELRRGRQW